MLSQQEISDRLEIEDLLVRYCYAVDDRNWDSYRRIFTADAVIDDTKTGGIKSNVAVRTHCSCPMKLDLGGGKTQIFFQGLWYYDKLVRTADGWKINDRYEDGYWNQNVPADFKF